MRMLNSLSIPPHLVEVLPPSATVNEGGHLEIGGCDTVALAEEFGTPIFVYDESFLRARCREYKEAFASQAVPGTVYYASKAFSSIGMLQLAAQEGLCVDVSTEGELGVALRSGFPAERILLHGNNKSDAELDLAVGAGVGRIVIDSFDEIDRLHDLVRQRDAAPVACLVRITPGVDAKTHRYIRTGQEDSKFGLGVRNGQALAAVKYLATFDTIDLQGLHCHIGSQLFDLAGFREAVDVVVDLAAEASTAYGAPLHELNFGGGLGIAYTRDDKPVAVGVLARLLSEEILARAEVAGLQAPRMAVEPGRSIVGRAGVTLYSVGVIKELPGVAKYVAVDGGLSDNMRTALYQSEYETFLANRPEAELDSSARLAGKHCETGDVLLENAALPSDVRAGEILVTPATGAYGYAMANNYNMVGRPAVLFVQEGTARVVIRRETLDDLVSLME